VELPYGKTKAIAERLVLEANGKKVKKKQQQQQKKNNGGIHGVSAQDEQKQSAG